MFPQIFFNIYVKIYFKHVCVISFVFNLFPANKELGNVFFEYICLNVIKNIWMQSMICYTSTLLCDYVMAAE